MHLGAYMTGGRIEVHGNASDWIGAEMKNGFIHIHGNAGGQVGAAYRGSLRGMKNGTIIIDGSAGLEVGMRMRRGTIVIGGPARDFTGLQMKGGTIVLLERRRDSHRRLDESRHDHFPEAAADDAHLCLFHRRDSGVLDVACQAPENVWRSDSVHGFRRDVPHLRRRYLRLRQRRNPDLATLSMIKNRTLHIDAMDRRLARYQA